MNGYERIKDALEYKTTDTPPVMLHNFMPAVKAAGVSMDSYRDDPGVMAQIHLDAARRYGLDGILLDVDTCLEAGAIGVPVEFPSDRPAAALGPASQDVDELIEMMSPDKLLKYDRVKKYLEAVHIMKNQAAGELWIRGNCDQMAFSLAMLAYGMQRFMEDLMDEECEDKIIALIDRAYDVHLTLHKLVMEAGADMTSFGDSSCGPDLISRAMYLKYAYPWHLRLKKDLDGLGIQTVCHICGNLDNILKDVASIGFSGVEVDAKTNIAYAAREFSGKSVVFGTLDPTGVFYLGSSGKVADETKKTLEHFGGNGIIIGAGCALSPLTPPENIEAFVRAVREY